MIIKLVFCSTVMLLACSIFFSCQKEFTCDGCVNDNKPPIANAGRDTILVLPQDSLMLDGNASYDPDGSIREYLWAKISGPSIFTIIKIHSIQAIIKNLTEGVYQFELKVTDSGGLSARDTVVIKVISIGTTNQPPISDAGPDQIITLPVNTVTLNGSQSTDPDNNITAYLWTKISGPSSFHMSNGNAVQTQVTNLVQGVYRFQLRVTDHGNLTAIDTVHVIVHPPDTMSNEIIFSDLIWNYWHDPNDIDSVFDEIYIVTPGDSANLFINVSYTSIQVFVKLDSSSIWIPANPVINGACSPPYTYTAGPAGVSVYMCPLDYGLIGESASMKVMF